MQAFSLSGQFARAMLKLPPKRGGDGASQRERGGGLSFFRPRTYRKGYYFYSPQSSTVIKSKMAATTILRTRTRFRPPKIRLHCRLKTLLSTPPLPPFTVFWKLPRSTLYNENKCMIFRGSQYVVADPGEASPPPPAGKKIKILTWHKAPLLCIKLTLLVSTVFARLRQSQMSPFSCIGDVRMEAL